MCGPLATKKSAALFHFRSATKVVDLTAYNSSININIYRIVSKPVSWLSASKYSRAHSRLCSLKKSRTDSPLCSLKNSVADSRLCPPKNSRVDSQLCSLKNFGAFSRLCSLKKLHSRLPALLTKNSKTNSQRLVDCIH